nr:phenylalanine--tRNA ligase alpha subunit, cytoplasmic [Ipomoea batatas]
MAEDAVLGFLEKNEEILDSGKFSEEKGISHDEMVNAINSLNGFGFVIAQDIKSERWVLTDEGKIYATAGSPEVQLFLAIPPEGITQEELQKKYPAIFKVGWPQAMKNKWVEKGKSNVLRKVQNVDDTVKDLLMQIQNGENLKEYNFSAKGQPVEGGHLHPLLKLLNMAPKTRNPKRNRGESSRQPQEQPQHRTIDIGRLISRSISEIAQTEAKTHCFLGHPSLITELCRRAGVPILENQEVRLPPQLYLSQHDIQTRYGQGQFPDPDDAENEDQANDEAMEDPAPAAHAPDQFPP